MFFVGCVDFSGERVRVGGRAVARGGVGWMVLATALNVWVWAWAGQAQAQPVHGDALMVLGQPVSAQQARLVVYRNADDELPQEATVRINGSYLANLQRASFVVVCLPAQAVLLSMTDGMAQWSAQPMSVALQAGQTRYILASDAPDQALVMRGLPVDQARSHLLGARAAVRTRSRFKPVQPCQPEAGVREETQVTRAAQWAAD